jgi:hypothetical protein
MSKYKTIKLTIRGMNKHLGTMSEERTFFSVGSVCDEVLGNIHRTHFKHWPSVLLVSVEETA